MYDSFHSRDAAPNLLDLFPMHVPAALIFFAP
jgi:hypothetical protein